MPGTHRWKLFVMMVLQFFIWGAWLPLIFGYLPSLGFTASEQSWILNAFPIAAIVGMFFSNQFADRTFAAEKFLAFSHLVGGAAMVALAFSQSPGLGFVDGLVNGVVAFVADKAGVSSAPCSPGFWPFLILMYVHCLLYVPTISITNSIAFTHLKDAQRDFGIVRMGGTIGWILAAWPFTFLFVDWDAVSASNPQGLVGWIGEALAHPLVGDAAKAATKWTYLVAGGASLLLAMFSLTLPHTPPRASERTVWLDALGLLRKPFVLVLWLVAFVDSFVHNCFFSWAGRFLASERVGIPSNWVMPVMSIGQVAEILTMLALGTVLRRLGWRATMVVGVLGHAARFAVFAYLPEHAWLVVTINALHGICYAFFFATVYLFVEAYLPRDMRTSAQGLFNLMILGGGALLANSLCPDLFAAYTKDGVTDFRGLFEVPLWTAVGAALLLVIAFHPPKVAAANGGTADNE